MNKLCKFCSKMFEDRYESQARNYCSFSCYSFSRKLSSVTVINHARNNLGQFVS